MAAIWFTLGFGVLGYLFRRLDVSVLPFVIAFILAGNLEDTRASGIQRNGRGPVVPVFQRDGPLPSCWAPWPSL